MDFHYVPHHPRSRKHTRHTMHWRPKKALPPQRDHEIALPRRTVDAVFAKNHYSMRPTEITASQIRESGYTHDESQGRANVYEAPTALQNCEYDHDYQHDVDRVYNCKDDCDTAIDENGTLTNVDHAYYANEYVDSGIEMLVGANHYADDTAINAGMTEDDRAVDEEQDEQVAEEAGEEDDQHWRRQQQQIEDEDSHRYCDYDDGDNDDDDGNGGSGGRYDDGNGDDNGRSARRTKANNTEKIKGERRSKDYPQSVVQDFENDDGFADVWDELSVSMPTSRPSLSHDETTIANVGAYLDHAINQPLFADHQYRSSHNPFRETRVDSVEFLEEERREAEENEEEEEECNGDNDDGIRRTSKSESARLREWQDLGKGDFVEDAAMTTRAIAPVLATMVPNAATMFGQNEHWQLASAHSSQTFKRNVARGDHGDQRDHRQLGGKPIAKRKSISAYADLSTKSTGHANQYRSKVRRTTNNGANTTNRIKSRYIRYISHPHQQPHHRHLYHHGPNGETHTYQVTASASPMSVTLTTVPSPGVIHVSMPVSVAMQSTPTLAQDASSSISSLPIFAPPATHFGAEDGYEKMSGQIVARQVYPIYQQYHHQHQQQQRYHPYQQQYYQQQQQPQSPQPPPRQHSQHLSDRHHDQEQGHLSRQPKGQSLIPSHAGYYEERRPHQQHRWRHDRQYENQNQNQYQQHHHHHHHHYYAPQGSRQAVTKRSINAKAIKAYNSSRIINARTIVENAISTVGDPMPSVSRGQPMVGIDNGVAYTDVILKNITKRSAPRAAPAAAAPANDVVSAVALPSINNADSASTAASISAHHAFAASLPVSAADYIPSVAPPTAPSVTSAVDASAIPEQQSKASVSSRKRASSGAASVTAATAKRKGPSPSSAKKRAAKLGANNEGVEHAALVSNGHAPTPDLASAAVSGVPTNPSFVAAAATTTTTAAAAAATTTTIIPAIVSVTDGVGVGNSVARFGGSTADETRGPRSDSNLALGQPCGDRGTGGNSNASSSKETPQASTSPLVSPASIPTPQPKKKPRKSASAGVAGIHGETVDGKTEPGTVAPSIPKPTAKRAPWRSKKRKVDVDAPSSDANATTVVTTTATTITTTPTATSETATSASELAVVATTTITATGIDLVASQTHLPIAAPDLTAVIGNGIVSSSGLEPNSPSLSLAAIKESLVEPRPSTTTMPTTTIRTNSINIIDTTIPPDNTVTIGVSGAVVNGTCDAVIKTPKGKPRGKPRGKNGSGTTKKSKKAIPDAAAAASVAAAAAAAGSDALAANAAVTTVDPASTFVYGVVKTAVGGGDASDNNRASADNKDADDFAPSSVAETLTGPPISLPSSSSAPASSPSHTASLPTRSLVAISPEDPGDAASSSAPTSNLGTQPATKMKKRRNAASSSSSLSSSSVPSSQSSLAAPLPTKKTKRATESVPSEIVCRAESDILKGAIVASTSTVAELVRHNHSPLAHQMGETDRFVRAWLSMADANAIPRKDFDLSRQYRNTSADLHMRKLPDSLSNDVTTALRVLWGIQSAMDHVPFAQPVNLTRQALLELRSEEYMVTPKADGIRAALVITNMVKGHQIMFFIDRAGNKWHAGVRAKKRLFAGTIIDGELCKEADTDAFVFWAFDMVAIDGKCIRSRAAIDRIGLLAEVLNPSDPDIAPDGTNPMTVRLKASYPAKQIADCFATMDNGKPEDVARLQLPNQTDGIILTPAQSMLQTGTSWEQYKWKAEHTLDFELRAIRADAGGDWLCALYYVIADSTVALSESYGEAAAATFKDACTDGVRIASGIGIVNMSLSGSIDASRMNVFGNSSNTGSCGGNGSDNDENGSRSDAFGAGFVTGGAPKTWMCRANLVESDVLADLLVSAEKASKRAFRCIVECSCSISETTDPIRDPSCPSTFDCKIIAPRLDKTDPNNRFTIASTIGELTETITRDALVRMLER